MKSVALIYSAKIEAPTGASAVIRSFANNTDAMSNYGVAMSIITPETINSNGTYELQKDKDSGIYKFLVRKIKKYARNHLIGAIIVFLFQYIRIKSVKQYLNKNTDDEIVFFHELFTCYKYIKKRRNKAPIIVLVLHTNGDTFSMDRQYYKTIEGSFFYKHLLRIEKEVLKEVDKIGFVADCPRQLFLKIHPEIEFDKTFYIYNGLPSEVSIRPATQKRMSTYKICCVGTVSERKGQPLIVEALIELQKKSIVPDVHFSIIGGGTILDELKILSKEKAVSQYISFIGSSDNVSEFLASSTIFILPSFDEGFPIAILEAMRAGLPIVSTKVGGIPEMIQEGYNGIFIEPSISGIIDFLSNIDKYDWGKMGENSRELFLKKFTLERMIESYSNIFKSV